MPDRSVFLGVPAEPAELARRHLPSSSGASAEDLVRIARRLSLKARIVSTKWDRLVNTPLPAIAEDRDGAFAITTRFIDTKLLVQHPTEPRGRLIKRAEFEKTWSGRLVLLGRRGAITNLPDTFDLRWFAAAVQRYWHIIGEVVIASFFPSTARARLATVFQVVVDKVLVHRSLSTLDVLMIGLAIVSLFEVTLGVLRAFVFSQTTNKIDVELGARLFDHLLALPMAYFANRRVDDSVARVRELENVRNFITGPALTLTIDLVFTFVFFAVMFFYSIRLTWVSLACCRP